MTAVETQTATASDEAGLEQVRAAQQAAGREPASEWYVDGEGVRIQARGREASPQGYYGFFFIFETGPAANIPRNRLQEALAAEGLPTCGTYGPVYRHMLYNMPRQRYRIAGGETCPVADTIGTDRAVGLLHQRLDADDTTLDAIGDIVAKVAQNVPSLKQ